MHSPISNDRVFSRLAPSEYQRRWDALRGLMGQLDIPAVLVLSWDDSLNGYVRWLTDRPTAHSYNSIALFRADAPMVMVEHGGMGGWTKVEGQPDYLGVSEVYTTAAFKSIRYTAEYEADIVCKLITDWGYKRLGIAGAKGMPHGFMSRIEKLGCELVDVTDAIDEMKALKSPYELEQVRAIAAMQDEVFVQMIERMEPGMRDQDIMAIAQYESRLRGSEQGVYMFGSAPGNQPAPIRTPHNQARRMEKGDHISILIETNGPTGFYTELGRTIVMGKASQQLIDAVALACEAQAEIAQSLVAGATCGDIAELHNQFLEAHGLPKETRLFSHGQGYDLVERPLIRGDEPMKLRAGMNIVVHPSFVMGPAFGYICDNFIVQESGGAQRIHKTEQKIFEI